MVGSQKHESVFSFWLMGWFTAEEWGDSHSQQWQVTGSRWAVGVPIKQAVLCAWVLKTRVFQIVQGGIELGSPGGKWRASSRSFFSFSLPSLSFTQQKLMVDMTPATPSGLLGASFVISHLGWGRTSHALLCAFIVSVPAIYERK